MHVFSVIFFVVNIGVFSSEVQPLLTVLFPKPNRGHDGELRRQHVSEGGAAQDTAHRGRGRVPALYVPEGLWFADGHHIPAVSRYAACGAGWRPSQTHREPG